MLNKSHLRSRFLRRFPSTPRYLLSALLLVGCAPGLYHPPPPPKPITVAELEQYIGDTIADSDPPSISIAVSRANRTLFARAFGQADGPMNIQATPDTTYRWFSVTKPFTAVAILQLVERGLISPSDPASKFLPYLTELYGDAASEITIGRLLTHQSGIGDVGNDILSWVHLEGHYNQSDLLRQRLPKYAHFDRTQLDQGYYSNLGYMILGAVIESVSSESYESYVANHILTPLGMKRTGFYYSDPFPQGTLHATGSHPDDFMAFVASFTIDLGTLARECTASRWWFEPFSPDQTAPSGLISTSSDMLRFGQMILGGGMLDGQRILDEASVQRMTTRQAVVRDSPVGALPGYSFGDSWFIGEDASGRKVLLHGGQGMAFTSLLMIRPDDQLTAAFVANGTYIDNASGLDLMSVVADMDWEEEPSDR